ncbi:MAG TPA: medium chain dehydrogenase/reductase family protein [Myxococcaceae bacterium]|nr:medium chain dehydrogenase/reductase family protein [Myxococcaceae bacterium]
MRALTITRYGPPEVLAIREAKDPVPGPGQVCIRVARAGLNFADVSARVGLYPDAPKPPMVMGYEVSGTVASLGEGVSAPPVGTRVLAMTHFGGQATHALADGRYVIPLPETMDLDQAAAFPVNWLTAHHMLHRVANLKPGMALLVHMAAGGVGLAAIALARAVGGVTIFGSASASKHGVLREAGVDHPIDYRTQDYVEEVKRLTGGRGVDLVLDALGGPEWTRNTRVLAPVGQLICFGWANAASGESRNLLKVATGLATMKRWNALELMSKNISVSGVNVGHLWGEASTLRATLDALMRLWREGKVRSHIDQVFPLAEGAAAHRRMHERKNVGKILFDCA